MLYYFLVSGGGNTTPDGLKRFVDRAFSESKVKAVLDLNNWLLRYVNLAIVTKAGAIVKFELADEFARHQFGELEETLLALPAEERWNAALQYIETDVKGLIGSAITGLDKICTDGPSDRDMSLAEAVSMLRRKLVDAITGTARRDAKQMLSNVLLGAATLSFHDADWALALLCQMDDRTGPFCNFALNADAALSTCAVVVNDDSHPLTLDSDDAVILIVYP